MSKNYDLIANVDIDLNAPVVDETSFDNLLIVGPLPKVAPKEAPPEIAAYASIDEVKAAGWQVEGEEIDPVGVAAQLAFGQNPRPTRIYIAPIQMVEGEASEDGEEAAEAVPESAVIAIQRAIASNEDWYVVCPAGVDHAEFTAIAEYIETTEKMFCYTEMNCFPEAGAKRAEGEALCIPTVSGNYFRTMWVYGREKSAQARDDVPAVNQFLNVAWVIQWLQYAAGSETAAFKAPIGVNPAKLSTQEMDAIIEAKGNFFTTVGNRNVVINGMTCGGEWADIIRFRDWQKNDMQVAVANLFISRPKVPYTDAGIALVQNQIVASLKRGLDRGGIAEEEFDADGNSIPSYTTSVPLAASITAAQKATRKLTGLKFSARLAGAIHFADIHGSLTYEM